MTPLPFARRLNDGIRQSRLVVLTGAGHGLLTTRWHQVTSLIEGFLHEEGV
ncbi:MAG: hypothetical protein EXR55_02615 [Dehalococcoidia bacterium]|nr:hypothetical protein [Dehalococcoidia bacterium]